jgi:hypothetical protein
MKKSLVTVLVIVFLVWQILNTLLLVKLTSNIDDLSYSINLDKARMSMQEVNDLCKENR